MPLKQGKNSLRVDTFQHGDVYSGTQGEGRSPKITLAVYC